MNAKELAEKLVYSYNDQHSEMTLDELVIAIAEQFDKKDKRIKRLESVLEYYSSRGIYERISWPEEMYVECTDLAQEALDEREIEND